MKIYFVFLITLVTSVTASAQIERNSAVIKKDSPQTVIVDNKVDKQSRKERFKELNLTREQKMKMKEIMQANKAAKDAIENNTHLSEPEKKKHLRDLQKAQAQKIQSILTPEQREKLKASRQNNP